MKHGRSAYTNRGCRCAICRQAQALYTKQRRDLAAVMPLPADDSRHGKASTYQNLCCRCELCTAAQATSLRDYRQRLGS